MARESRMYPTHLERVESAQDKLNDLAESKWLTPAERELVTAAQADLEQVRLSLTVS